ncbi:MAG: WD40/YVTN/BNR-like repeat-containing protein, partial [Bryobacteraceae bacterium]
NLYDIAFDPTDARRIAVCGWGPGVMVSEDGGATWELRNRGLPRPDVWSVAFDPDRPGRLYASVHEEALYVSEDAGRTWRVEGLPGSIIYKLAFVPAKGGAR